MATYPLSYSEGSTASRITGLEHVLSRDNTDYVYVNADEDIKIFTIVHTSLTTAEYNSLETFYENNKTASFDFNWRDGKTYSCKWVDPALSAEPSYGPGGEERWEVEATFRGKEVTP